MEDRETPRMHKYGESRETRIMMTIACHVTSSSGLRNFRPFDFVEQRVHHLCQSDLRQRLDRA